MRVLKIVAEGQMTSFRYPFFMLGVQPTFTMPPPSTLYGHVASALGEWFDPTGVHFAVHFIFEKRVLEIEHTHVLKSATGRIPGKGDPKVLEGATNPYQREVLFRPKLTLYLNRPEWLDAFRCPKYPVVLGRSQDLFTYTDIRVIDLHKRNEFYVEHTLLPYEFRRYISKGIAVLMPQYLDNDRQRFPHFRQFIVLNRRVHVRDFIYPGDNKLSLWVDPSAPAVDGDQLGLVFHAWTSDEETSITA